MAKVTFGHLEGPERWGVAYRKKPGTKGASPGEAGSRPRAQPFEDDPFASDISLDEPVPWGTGESRLTGNTFPVRDEIKARGGWWFPEQKPSRPKSTISRKPPVSSRAGEGAGQGQEALGAGQTLVVRGLGLPRPSGGHHPPAVLQPGGDCHRTQGGSPSGPVAGLPLGSGGS